MVWPSESFGIYWSIVPKALCLKCWALTLCFIMFQVMKHRVVLSTLHRARDPILQRLVRDSMSGMVSPDTVAAALSLSRPLDAAIEKKAVHLYATNFECDCHNAQELQLIPRPSQTYTAVDEGGAFPDGRHIPWKLKLKVIKKYSNNRIRHSNVLYS